MNLKYGFLRLLVSNKVILALRRLFSRRNAGEHLYFSVLFSAVKWQRRLKCSQLDVANRVFKKAHQVYVVCKCQCHYPPPACARVQSLHKIRFLVIYHREVTYFLHLVLIELEGRTWHKT